MCGRTPSTSNWLADAVPRSRLTITSRAAFSYGSGRSNTPLTIEKIAVFTPMPTPSVITTTAAKPG